MMRDHIFGKKNSPTHSLGRPLLQKNVPVACFHPSRQRLRNPVVSRLFLVLRSNLGPFHVPNGRRPAGFRE